MAHFTGLPGIKGQVASQGQLHRGGCGLVTTGATVAVAARAAIATFGALAAVAAMHSGLSLAIGARLLRRIRSNVAIGWRNHQSAVIERCHSRPVLAVA